MKNQLIFHENTVKKQFHSKIACHKEKEILTLMAGTGLCPEILYCDEHSITMTALPGKPLSFFTEDTDITHIIGKTIEWMCEFNNATENVVLDDINLKNFLFSPSEDKVYGIDFECWHIADNRQNFAGIAAMVANARMVNKATIYDNTIKQLHTVAGTDSITLKEMTEEANKATDLRRKAMPLVRKSDCVILAGGKSSRMGRTKGLLEYNGHTFVDHIIYNTSVFDRQYISANDNQYDHCGFEIIGDIFRDAGPMGAIHAAFETCDNEYVFFIPCDMPLISEETIMNMFSKTDSGADAIIFTANNRIFPTVGIYRKNTLTRVVNLLESGNFKLMHLLDSINTQYVPAPYPHQFVNINTPEDFQSLISCEN